MSEWKSVQLGELVEKAFSGPSPTCEERNIQNEHEWGVLKTTSVTWSGWNVMAHKILPENYWGQEALEVKAGDIIVTKAGPRHRVGVVVHVDKTIPRLIVSGKMIGLRVKSDICLPDVLAGLLSTRAPQKHLDHRTTGMAESQVNFANSALLQTSLRIPPKEEQEVISSIGRHLDTQIHKTEALIAKLEKVNEGLLHDLLTRGIDENGQLRPSPEQAPELYKKSPLGLIPRVWSDCSLGEVYIQASKNGLYKPASYHGRGFPMVQMGGMFKSHIVDFNSASLVEVTESEIKTFGLDNGDLIFARRSLVLEGAGLCCIVKNLKREATFESSMIRVRVDRNESDPEYICLFLRSERSIADRRKYIRQVAVSGVSGDDVKSFRVALPSLDEQLKIVARHFSLETKINSEKESLIKLKLHKNGLMDSLLTGRVRVTPLLDQAQATTPA